MEENPNPTVIEKTVIDQMQRPVTFPHPPQRIVSLVPSQTELLFALEVGNRVVGRTKFCVYPQPEIEAVQSIGGTKKFRFDVIDHLQPDLIIGNKEENYQEGIEQLEEAYPVWMSDVRTLDDALQMIHLVGDLVGKRALAGQLAHEIQEQFDQLHPPLPRRVAYFIWHEPHMVVGNDTFIDDMLGRCGFINAFADEQLGRYPKVSNEEIAATNLDAILLSSEPFPFATKHIDSYQQLAPQAQVLLVDGQPFSWYGNRLLTAVPYFQEIITAIHTQ